MNKRILKDKRALKEAGYKSPKLEKSFNYFDNWETAVMIYSVKTDKGLEVKYSFPEFFNIKELYAEHIEPHIKGKVEHIDEEYERFGCRYAVVVEREDGKHIYNAKVSPNFTTVIKETYLSGGSNA